KRKRTRSEIFRVSRAVATQGVLERSIQHRHTQVAQDRQGQAVDLRIRGGHEKPECLCELASLECTISLQARDQDSECRHGRLAMAWYSFALGRQLGFPAHTHRVPRAGGWY